MKFDLTCVAHRRKITICIFVAAVILILFAHYRYMSSQIFYGKNNFITASILGTSNSSLSKRGTILSRTDTFEKKQYSNILSMPTSFLRREKSSYHLYDYGTKTINETVLNKLSKDLRIIMAERLPPEEMNLTETCSEESVGNSCENDICLQLQLPKDPQIRLEQLIRPEKLHPDAKYVNVMHDMGNAIPGFYDIILITGASSNHYLESKKHLYNIHTNVLPHLRNFTIIYYNLGLTARQKADISSMCRCHMLDFPFDKFPKFVSLLKCFSWKPIVINAHAPHCNIIHWMDASIRYFNNSSILRELLRRTRVHGVVESSFSPFYMPHRTLREMFHFFGDEACIYLQYTQVGGGFIMFLNEPLIKWGIIEPWTACALNKSCMCIKHPNEGLSGCKKRTGPNDYGRCHHYDQSALGIIIRKLFREKADHLFLLKVRHFVEVKRGDKWKERIPSKIIQSQKNRLPDF